MRAIERDYWPTKEWRTTDPSLVGLNSEKFTELLSLIGSKYKNINGIAIVRKGYLALERYYNGYNPLDTHNVASVTKSFISALLGIAIDKGLINGVDQRVVDFFPEHVSSSDKIKKHKITIKHLLTMTTPFALAKGMYEPFDRLRRQRDWVRFIFTLMGRNGQLGKFQYSTSATHLLSAIITRSTGLCAREFANKHLFKPLGMKEVPDNNMKSFSIDEVFGKKVRGWVKDPQGNTTGGWGLTITLRDMARFGFLYINRGIWKNRKIISEKWFDESTTPYSETLIDDSLIKYGYLWWIKEEQGIICYLAMGAGGNIICFIPEKDVVVAIASKIIRKPRDRWPLFENYILPAIID